MPRPLALSAAALAALAALAGCGGGDAADPADVVGMYQVTRHTLSQATVASQPVSCAAEGPAVTEPPYFHLLESDFDDVELEECTGATADTCAFTLVDFALDGLFTAHSNTQTGGGTDCALYHSEYRATPDGAGGIRLELRDWIVYPDPAPSDCALELAEALADSDDCYTVEVIEGTRLP